MVSNKKVYIVNCDIETKIILANVSRYGYYYINISKLYPWIISTGMDYPNQICILNKFSLSNIYYTPNIVDYKSASGVRC